MKIINEEDKKSVAKKNVTSCDQRKITKKHFINIKKHFLHYHQIGGMQFVC
jgi:hypothetical protein